MFPFIVFKVVFHFDALNSPQFVKDLVRYIPSVLGRKEGRNVTRHNFIYTKGLAVYYGFRV